MSDSVTKKRNTIEADLDAALKATFPASDPVAVGQDTDSEPRRPVDRRPALIDKALVERLAKRAAEKLKRRR